MTACLLTPAARADLDDIWEYTVARWGAAQASSYLRTIAAACAGLADGTTASQDAGHVRAGYRKAISGRHVLFFRHTEAQIVVVRILHQRMDVDTQRF